MKKFIFAAGFMPPIFDTLVFGFISYRLATRHANDSDHSHWQTFFTGKSLPQLSKAMLQGGQQYYLLRQYFFNTVKLLTLGSRLTTVMNIAILALGSSSSIPKILQIICVVPGVALTSMMACNVQRNLLSGGNQGTEVEPGIVESLGLSFTDITSFFTRLYRSEGSTDNMGHVGAQNDIPEVKTWPMVDPVFV